MNVHVRALADLLLAHSVLRSPDEPLEYSVLANAPPDLDCAHEEAHMLRYLSEHLRVTRCELRAAAPGAVHVQVSASGWTDADVYS